MPSITFFKPSLVAEINNVFSCIKSFPKGTSCGRYGLRGQHILDALCGEGSATATDLLKVITSVVNLWLAGMCPPILAEFVASATLTPLLKPDRDSTHCSRHYMETFSFQEEVSRVLDIIKVSGPGLGLELNIKKTEIFWPSYNGMKLRKGLFPIDIRRPSSGVKLLGGAVSRDADFISVLDIRRVANAVDLMGLLPQLHDPQSELLLLRSCMGIAKLFFGLRTCQPVHMENAALFFDKDLLGSIENIVVFPAFDWSIYTVSFSMIDMFFIPPENPSKLALDSAAVMDTHADVTSKKISFNVSESMLGSVTP
nr:reverse transcriptase domain-containing protein [Tanacetum cinerariifolium]